MQYIFLDFSQRRVSEDIKRHKKNMFNNSLEEQYHLINNKITLGEQYSSYINFVDSIFPTSLPKTYFISWPNFGRSNIDPGNDFTLENVIVRSQLADANKFSNESKSITLICDLKRQKSFFTFVVKGIELLDNPPTNYNELVFADIAACVSVEKKQWKVKNHTGLNNFVNMNFVNELFKHSVLNMPNKVIDFYNSWDEYLTFREYYLNTQTSRNYTCSFVEYVEAYVINRRAYYRNQSLYDEHLLDDEKEFSKGELIVLNDNVSSSTDPFHLIKVGIEINREEYKTYTVLKGNKEVNTFEANLKSFARENLALSGSAYDEANYNKILNNSHLLEDRFKIIREEIEPNFEDIIDKFKLNEQKQKAEIEEKYKRKINKEVDEQIIIKSLEIDRVNKDALKMLKEQTYSSIKSGEINIHNDVFMKNLYNRKYEEIKKVLSEDKNEKLNILKLRLNKETNQNQIDVINQEIYKVEDNYQKLVDNIGLRIKLDEIFVAKLDSVIAQKENELSNLKSIEIDRHKNSLYRDISLKYDKYKKEEFKIVEETTNISKEKEIEQRIKEEAFVRFSIFFKTDIEQAQNVKKSIHNKSYLIYNNRAEKAKIDRQRNALEAFFNGQLRNPFIIPYLFDSDNLPEIGQSSQDLKWFLEKLNDTQKTAVIKAISSKNLFLLQGPPGTGKTQVIAEIVGHLIRQNKKVLISSETHKAIDNVFERLPKVAEIRPLRLIPSQSSKETEYSPENLVDNLYINIYSNMQNRLRDFKNFETYKDKFNETLKQIKLKYQKIQNSKEESLKIENQIKISESKFDQLSAKKNMYIDNIEDARYQYAFQTQTYKKIEYDNLITDEDSDSLVIESYKKDLINIFTKFHLDYDLDVDNICNLNRIKPIDFRRQINDMFFNKEAVEIEVEISNLKKDIISNLENGIEEIADKQKRLVELRKQMNSFSRDDHSNHVYYKIFANYLEEIDIEEIVSIFTQARTEIYKVKQSYLNSISKKIQQEEKAIGEFDEKVNQIQMKLKDISNEINSLKENKRYYEYNLEKNNLEYELEKVFKDLNINKPYENILEAIQIIESEWKDLFENYEIRKKENKGKIPVYEKISRYINQTDIILEDRKAYTKSIFDVVNLFGSTTTSRDLFNEKALTELSEYNLGDLDLKQQGIDVVIVDEVSKSSFLEVLIPMLYGKSIILVGDHRQLPPMYEYRNFRKEDYEGLDENYINYYRNIKFTKLYETSFFKSLFERLSNDYKVMLNKQYRSHEHIMNVFNHFYKNNLKLGLTNQNEFKKHYLNISGNYRMIIEQDKHIYFIDSKEYESRSDDSTSIQNRGEAEIIIELLHKINDAYLENKYFTPNVIKQDNIDERMSIGVICTYGDQARLIKQKAKGIKFQSYNEKTDSKLIISTVDDFQGDERDIIIVSMVRNPQNPEKSDPGFINAYQRVNVAFSRARRLLIIVGNKDYLVNKGVINLPDVMGKSEHDQINFRIYEKVIDTVQQYGKVLTDEDIIMRKDDM